MSGPSPARAVATFRDALGLGFELGFHYPQGHFAIVVGPGDRPVQLTARLPESGWHDVMVDAAGRHTADLLGEIAGHGGGLLIISLALRFRPFEAHERAAYLKSRAGLARRGIVLRDWIRSDGDLYQSAAYATHPESAWPDDPPAERRAECCHHR